MEENILYEENRLSIGMIIIVGSITLILTYFLIHQLLFGPTGTKSVPTYILIFLVVLFALSTINFSRIRIRLTDSGMSVYYGILGSERKWSDFTTCEKDGKNYFYGWGIRFGRYKKQWVWIYNVVGGPRVAFITSKSNPKGLIVSTLKPEEIVRIA